MTEGIDEHHINLGYKRCRGMTEGIDEHQINLLNANTQGMIHQNINQLHRQSSIKKNSMANTESLGLTSPAYPLLQASFMPLQLRSEHSTSSNFESSRDMNEESSAQTEMRRAVSYCQTRTFCPSDEDPSSKVSEFSTGRNEKHRRAIQAKQAWIKYIAVETNSTKDSIKQLRN